MSSQTWVQCLVASQVPGAAVTASTTATSILPTSAVYTLPNNYFDVVGKTLRIKVIGNITSVAATTLLLEVRLGGVTPGAAGTGQITLNATDHTANYTFALDWLLTATAVGLTAHLMHTSTMVSTALLGGVAPATSGTGVDIFPSILPAIGPNFDSSQAWAIDVYATWSLNNGSSIKSYMYTLESLN